MPSQSSFSRQESIDSFVYDSSTSFPVGVSPTNALKVVTPVKLAGASFQGDTIDSKFWVTSLGTGGAVTQSNAEVMIDSGNTANNSTSLSSLRIAHYLGGSANAFRSVIVLPPVTTSGTGHTNTRQWGAFDVNNGMFFEAVQTNPSSVPTLRLRTRKAGVTASAITSFNGAYGTSYTLDNNVHTWEIFWTNSSIWFMVDGKLLHKASALTTTLTGATSLKVAMASINSGGCTGSNIITVRIATISRLGPLLSQPTYLYQAGVTSGVIAKYGVGNLHKVIASSLVTGCTVTIYDGIDSGGTIIHSFTYTQGQQANNQPFDIDFGGIPFSIGLFLTITNAACNVTLIYE